MTRPTSVRQSRGDVDISDLVPWLNVAEETIPAYGVVQLRTNFASGLSQASKPNSTTGIFFASGSVAVASGSKGESLLWNRPRRVKVEETLSVGDQVGPVDGSWAMTTSGKGFFVIHQDQYEIATVMPIGGGGDLHKIWFEIHEVYCADSYDEWHLIVTPTWYNVGCSAVPPGADSYGRVSVYDLCNYHIGLVAEELPGSTGRATYMYPMNGYCEPKWIIDDLCQQPECP